LDAFETLMSQYSVGSIVFVLILAGVAVKFLGELLAYFSEKLSNYFGMRQTDKTFKEETQRQLQLLVKQREEDETFRMDTQKTLSDLLKNQEQILETQQLLADKIDDNTHQVSLLQDRMQDSTRAYIIDKYHYFKMMGVIDIMSLEDLERRFMYYKEAGGDTFIDGLMEEIRALPDISPKRLLEFKENKNDIGTA